MPRATIPAIRGQAELLNEATRLLANVRYLRRQLVKRPNYVPYIDALQRDEYALSILTGITY